MLLCSLGLPRFAFGTWSLPATLLAGLAMAISPVIAAAAPDETVASDDKTPRNILFFGDSLTAGYGLANASAQAFPALIQQKLKDAGLNYFVINAGLSGDTTSGGLRRIDWLLKRPVAILVLELGGNDGLRGLPTDQAARNLQLIIDKTRAANPQVKVVIAGMKLPPSLGPDYVTRFEAIYPALAKQNPTATLLPFVLLGVGGDPRYNQRDQIHPNAEGHRIIADLVWSTLEPLCR